MEIYSVTLFFRGWCTTAFMKLETPCEQEVGKKLPQWFHEKDEILDIQMEQIS